MLSLQTFGPAFGLADPSPFVLKAMVLLNQSGLPYRQEPADVRKAPKLKLPVLIDGELKVPDTTFIRFHLETRYAVDFDKGLDVRKKALAWSIEKMIEDHLYWAMVHERWMIDRNFHAGPVNFFSSVPAPIRSLVVRMVRKKVRQNLYAHGLGRHSREEMMKLAFADIDALSAILGEQPFLMGETECGADATAFAFAWAGLCPIFETPVRDRLASRENIVAYVQRMKARHFPDI